MRNIDNTADVIDSRDIIERIEELEGERDAHNEDGPEEDWATAFFFEAAELATLKALAEQAESTPDWQYGETLIRESYFTDYIEEMVRDCYELPKEFDSGAWPWNNMKMDWDGAAEEAKVDYMEVDFDGVTYLIRVC